MLATSALIPPLATWHWLRGVVRYVGVRRWTGLPDLVLFDEPSQGLAPKIVEDVLQTIRRLRQEGIASIVVEQNAEIALSVADHAAIIDRGRIVWTGDAATLKDDTALRQRLLEDVGQGLELALRDLDRLERHFPAAREHEVEQLHRVGVLFLALQPEPVGRAGEVLHPAAAPHRDAVGQRPPVGEGQPRAEPPPAS